MIWNIFISNKFLCGHEWSFVDNIIGNMNVRHHSIFIDQFGLELGWIFASALNRQMNDSFENLSTNSGKLILNTLRKIINMPFNYSVLLLEFFTDFSWNGYLSTGTNLNRYNFCRTVSHVIWKRQSPFYVFLSSFVGNVEGFLT